MLVGRRRTTTSSIQCPSSPHGLAEACHDAPVFFLAGAMGGPGRRVSRRSRSARESLSSLRQRCGCSQCAVAPSRRATASPSPGKQKPVHVQARPRTHAGRPGMQQPPAQSGGGLTAGGRDLTVRIRAVAAWEGEKTTCMSCRPFRSESQRQQAPGHATSGATR